MKSIFKSFWFYFNFIPVTFSVLFFSLNFLYLWNISHNYERPAFEDAVEHCKNVSNDKWADHERTYQDKCIDVFIGGEENFIVSTFDVLWVLGLLVSIVGIAFIIPLTIYLLLQWRKRILLN